MKCRLLVGVVTYFATSFVRELSPNWLSVERVFLACVARSAQGLGA